LEGKLTDWTPKTEQCHRRKL